MKTAFHACLIVLPIFYTLLLAAYGRLFARGKEGLARLVRPLLLGTIALQMTSLLLSGLRVGACPLGSPAEFAEVLAFSILLVYLALEIRTGVSSTGVFAVLPALVIHVVAAVAVLEQDEQAPVVLDAFESIHIFAANLALAAVVLCTVYGFLYLFMYAAIKRGWFGLFFQRAPALETLSALNVAATWMAFLSLSVSLGLGYWQHFSVPSASVQLFQPVVVMSMSLWLLYGCCIVAWKFFGFGGKRLAYTTALGIVLVAGVFVWGLSVGFH